MTTVAEQCLLSSEAHTSFHDNGSQRNTLPDSSGGSRFLYSCGLSSFSRNNSAAAYEAEKFTIAANITNHSVADNVTMPAYTLCCCSNWSIFPAHQAHSGKSATAGLQLWAHAGKDRRMGNDHFTDPALHTIWAVSVSVNNSHFNQS